MANPAVFSPFLVEPKGSEKEPVSSSSRRMLVPDSSRASGVRPLAPPRQRYRVIQPVPLARPSQARSIVDTRYRRPKPALGSGERLGAPPAISTHFAKTANFLPSRSRKRVFFDEVDDESLAMRVLSQGEAPPKLSRKVDPKVTYEGGHDDEDQADIDMVGRNVEIPAQPSTSSMRMHKDEEYEEVDIDGLEDEAPRLSPPIDMSDGRQDGRAPRLDRMEDLRGASLRDGGTVGGYTNIPHIHKMRATSAAVKQLSGENSYLKDQLDACYYRIKQLENLLMERNMRLKQLLCENLKMSAKVKRLEAELGEDAAAEIIAAMEEEE